MGDNRRLAVIAAALALLTGCTSTPKTPKSPDPTPPATTTEPTMDPTGVPATPPNTPHPTVAAAPPVLGPTGIGALTLGLTRGQAEATGLVKPFQHTDDTNCSWTTTLVAAPATSTTAGTVLASDSFGVAAIFAYGSVGTPEQIKLGSPNAELTKAYPSASLKGSTAHGNVSVKVPGNGAAWYRFELQNGVVTEVALLLDAQNCEE